jgi:hypothetical protein
MKDNVIFYRPYNNFGLEGYYIPVRNTFNNHIEKEFIPKEAKDLYQNTFGEKIITDKEFLDWYATNAKNFK